MPSRAVRIVRASYGPRSGVAGADLIHAAWRKTVDGGDTDTVLAEDAAHGWTHRVHIASAVRPPQPCSSTTNGAWAVPGGAIDRDRQRSVRRARTTFFDGAGLKAVGVARVPGDLNHRLRRGTVETEHGREQSSCRNCHRMN